MNSSTTRSSGRGQVVVGGFVVALVFALSTSGAARAQNVTGFPNIPVWANAGAATGSAGADSLRSRARTNTLRWLRDPDAEARSDFGGYRIYRVQNTLDSTRMVLLRRVSKQPEDSLFLWHLPSITSATPLDQRVATYVDPDSSGAFVKRCRRVDEFGRCLSLGDSIFVLVPPPGPHDGFRTWYAITYEKRNGLDNEFIDLFVKDPACVNPDTSLCLNLNHKFQNVTGPPVEATPGPRANLEGVSVVPNPFRGGEAWDLPGQNEVHFVNLPSSAKIRIYTAAGDLVRELLHNDNVRDYEIWDLKNASGLDVVSGIYLFRVDAGIFSAQDRFVVIR
ncbi:MAG: hypothetical protein HOP12_15235 [Candidatus Eisenbacteria bacterium]|uniref:T9SS type A sorting domain-containing protein n=1 Tax=Eiseniibacteriota bacterium TaxID=2212470 RepID=A0A849SIB3_UNCEI|nr:hypothetical protein [Candidatus Eisenbacteria bacterium]